MTNGDSPAVAYLRTEREGIHGAAAGALPLFVMPSGRCCVRAPSSVRGILTCSSNRLPSAPQHLHPQPPAPAAAAPAAPHTVETLCQQLREVLPTRRLQSISLCDHEANVVWLSEGALGPDEHSLVTEALAALSEDTSLPCHEMGLEDGRLALCLPVRSPNGNVVGIAMILADRKSVGDDTLERMMAAPVRAIMQRLAVLLRPGDRPSSGTARVPVLELDEDPAITAALMAVEERIPTVAAAPGGAAVDTPISAAEIDDILEFDLDPEAAAARQDAHGQARG